MAGGLTVTDSDALPLELVGGRVVWVSPEDHERLSNYRWYYDGRYAFRVGQNNHKVYMHREILGLEETASPLQADHIDRDRLNNHRRNLRVATPSRNVANRAKYKVGDSHFKGVSWSKDRQRWRVQIGVEGSPVFVGVFDDEEEAARAYDAAAFHFWGEFACLNFPGEAPGSFSLRRSTRQTSSRYRGVTWNKERRKWRAAISAGGKYRSLGFFADEDEAARAYDDAAWMHYGNQARLNFPASARCKERT
jgi:hypothetical protein